MEQPQTAPAGRSGIAAADDRSPCAGGMGDLRVRVDKDDAFWFAQGLEVDYLAMGDTETQAKKHFERGLAATAEEHLLIHGHLDHLLTPAPAEAWKGVMKAAVRSEVTARRTPTRIPNLPFDGIAYISTDRRGQGTHRPRDPAKPVLR